MWLLKELVSCCPPQCEKAEKDASFSAFGAYLIGWLTCRSSASAGQPGPCRGGPRLVTGFFYCITGLLIHCIHVYAPPIVKYRGCMSISQKITGLILVRVFSLPSCSGNLSFQIPDNHTGKLSISSICLGLKLFQHSFQLLFRHFLSRKFVM